MLRLAPFALLVAAVASAADRFDSHPPMRPLPSASTRPLGKGPAYFVDAAKGDDAADGSRNRPWKTLDFAANRLRPGDTLYLRGGTYFEHVDITVSGDEGAPIAIRSFPGELAILDGGLPEFQRRPAESWQSLKGGADGEYVSTAEYPQFARRPILNSFLAAGWEPFYGKEEQRPVVLGNFADSMVPLHGYRTLADLRDDSMLWDVSDKFDKQAGVYCGPGLWFNRETSRIHVRLAHTELPGLGERAYRGETDPRKLPLVVSGPYGQDVLRMNGVRHIVLQDIALRGASGSPTINVYGCDAIALDGVTVFGGAPGMLVKATSGLRIVNSAFRGLAAPWSSRASMKYRGTPEYCLITQRNKPENHNFEISYSEFTDGHDGLWLRYVKNLRFHHNFVDNFNDDGLEVGARKFDQELYIYQNLLSRCALTFTLHEMSVEDGAGQPLENSGVFITRNVIDLRGGAFKSPPREAGVDTQGDYLKGALSLCGDHGGPPWPHYYFYHNTVVRTDKAWRGYYGFGMGGRGLRDTKRRVINNIFVQLEETPGLNVSPGFGDVFLDGNLHWGLAGGPAYEGDFFEKEGKGYAFRKTPRPAEWWTKDQFADPKLAKLTRDPRAAMDLRPSQDSPALNAGAAVPAEWFDPLRKADQGAPDIGALPQGVAPWQVGQRGRLDIFGEAQE